MKTYRISREDIAKRIDAFLTEKQKTSSRSRIQKAIKTGAVLINSRNVKPSYRLREDDIIEIRVSKKRKALMPNPKIMPHVLYEDEDIIVIHKPAALVVHPATFEETDTLVNGLVAHRPHLIGIGENPLRPGIVHRLDKETSGVMVIAKNENVFQWLKSQFQKRKVEKRYIALVHGIPKPPRGIIEIDIAKNKGKQVTGRAVEKLSLKSRSSTTEYRLLGTYKGNGEIFSLCEALPKTGRTHQIRVAFASLGHPIVGDKLYAFKGQKGILGLGRQFLHAANLKFQMPDDRVLEFEAPLPKDLKQTLDGLKKT